jgi:hypothetical protein
MKRWTSFLFGVVIFTALSLMATPKPKPGARAGTAVLRREVSVADGERRYRTNCARCHQAPPKFAPAATATVIRHMRVRAMMTDEDMHAILKFMTQ